MFMGMMENFVKCVANELIAARSEGGVFNPHFLAPWSSHELSQRPSPQKQFLAKEVTGEVA